MLKISADILQHFFLFSSFRKQTFIILANCLAWNVKAYFLEQNRKQKKKKKKKNGKYYRFVVCWFCPLLRILNHSKIMFISLETNARSIVVTGVCCTYFITAEVMERIVYVNITAGVTDMNVFNVPSNCNLAAIGPAVSIQNVICFVTVFLSHLLVKGCDTGVRISIRSSVRLSKFTSSLAFKRISLSVVAASVKHCIIIVLDIHFKHALWPCALSRARVTFFLWFYSSSIIYAESSVKAHFS